MSGGYDPCECAFSQEAAMRRLLSLVMTAGSCIANFETHVHNTVILFFSYDRDSRTVRTLNVITVSSPTLFALFPCF